MIKRKKQATRFIALTLAFIMMFLAASPTALQSAAEQVATVINADSVNVRANVGVSAANPPIDTRKRGDIVTILSSATASDGVVWYQVSYQNGDAVVTGYMSSAYLSFSTESTTTTAAVVTTATTPQTTAVVTTQAEITTEAPATEVAAAKTGFVNTQTLNIRKKRSTSSKIVKKVKYGTQLGIISSKTVKGIRWYKVKVTVKKKKYKGYVQASYLTLYKTKVKATQYQLTKSKKKLTIYKTANIYDKVQGVMPKGNQALLLGTVKVGKKLFARIKTWVNGKKVTGYVYAKKLTTLYATRTKAKKKTTMYVSTDLYARKIAYSHASKRGKLKAGTKIKTRGSITVDGEVWYLCTYSKTGGYKQGYIPGKYIVSTADVSELSFEASLATFPDSYKSYLQELHTIYPSWKFVAVNNGIDFNVAVANESPTDTVQKNTIQTTRPSGGKSGAELSYLFKNSAGNYVLKDGTTWYAANADTIKYYMDPRNYLTQIKIFAFEALAKDVSQDKAVVTKILSDTFMKGDYSVVDKATGTVAAGNYADAFMDASTISNASPYFLATKSRLEVGVNGSGSTSGIYTYNGADYSGYYNFFNIGATDSAGGGAVANGLTYASAVDAATMRPWTTPYKSIVGGASYIASSYIAKGQNTRYLMKFDLAGFSHQYMTSINGPSSEALSTYNTYNSMGLMQSTFVFYIPVYNNMPATPATLPAL